MEYIIKLFTTILGLGFPVSFNNKIIYITFFDLIFLFFIVSLIILIIERLTNVYLRSE